MLCGERWMRCTVRNKWWRIKIEKDKERHNTETQRSQRRVRTKAPERFGGLLFRNRDRGDGRPSSPPTRPDMRVRIRRFGGLS